MFVDHYTRGPVSQPVRLWPEAVSPPYLRGDSYTDRTHATRNSTLVAWNTHIVHYGRRHQGSEAMESHA